jgi:hypothetical protein
MRLPGNPVISADRRTLRAATVLSLSAGLVHGLNVQEHLREWWGYGLFFLFAAAAQFVYGLILLVQPWHYDSTGGRRDGSAYARWFYLAGIVANGLIILLYIVTRTIGVPLLGPAAGRVERLSPVGALTTAVEALLVVYLFSLLRRGRPATRD